MSNRVKWGFGLGFILLLWGCTSTSSINLTPKRVTRSADGYYHFETTWESNRRGISTNVQAYVLIDTNAFPMTAVPFALHRYEAFVPLPPAKTYIPYRFRFDYDYPGVKHLIRDSDLSPSYRLIVPMDWSAVDAQAK